jgi:hypothetical protein
MPIPPQTHLPLPDLRAIGTQVGSMIVGPVSTLAALIALYFSVEVGCADERTPWRVVIVLAALATTTTAGAWAWRARRTQSDVVVSSRDVELEVGADVDVPWAARRARFCGDVGLAVSLFSAAVLLAFAVPLLLLRPCE